ncbi:hypothetical protein ACJ41O_013019 [Fusarium nematophilum]
MMSLNKIALAIRQSSRSSAITLARNFATTNRALDDLEDLVLIALETLYPNAPESLRKQLCDTMTDRYSRIEYNAYRTGKSRARPLKRLHHEEAVTERDDQSRAPTSNLDLPGTKLEEYRDRQDDPQAMAQKTQRKLLSSIDTGLLRQTLGKEYSPAPQSRRTLSAYQTDSRLHEPPPPRFEDESELERHTLLLHPSYKSNSDDDLAESVRQKLSLDETPSLDLCPLCLFVEKSMIDPEEGKGTKPEALSEPRKSTKESIDKKDTRVTFAEDVRPASGDCGRGSPDNSPSTPFGLELHVAAHLQYLTVLALRIVATLDYDSGQETAEGGSGLSDSATGSISSVEEGTGPEAWPEEESTVPYLSDSEVRRLEQTRSEEEAEKTIPSSEVEENWDRVRPVPEKSSGEDPVLQQLSSRHGESFRMDSLKETIKELKLAVEESPNGHPSRAELWWNIGILLGEQFEMTGRITDLNDAIEAFKAAIKITSGGRQDGLRYIRNLCFQLTKKYTMTGQEKDLDQAITALREVLGGDGPDQADHYAILGFLLGRRYLITGDVRDLDAGLARSRKAINLAKGGDRRQARYDSNLGLQLTLMYDRTGSQEAIDEAIQVMRRGLYMASPDDTERGEYLARLSVGLWKRSATSKSPEELEEAVRRMRDALDQVPQSHPNYLKHLNSLGAMLGDSYQRTGEADVLDEAIRIGRNVASLSPRHNRDAAENMENLASRLADRSELIGSIDDLDEAIELTFNENNLVPEEDPSWFIYRRSLAVRLSQRFSRRHSLQDLEQAVSFGREAVAVVPDDHVNRAACLNTLASTLAEMYSATGSLASLEEAADLYEMALENSYSPVLDRIHAGRQLLRRASQLSKWSLAYSASQKVISLLRELPFDLLHDSEKQSVQDESAGIIADGVAAASNANLDPYDALRLLEEGRGLLANNLVELRTELEALSRADRPLAEDFIRVRQELGRPLSAPMLAITGDSPWKAQSQRRQAASQELDKLVNVIRQLPQFDHFWSPPSRSAILHAIRRGPVVVLNASSIRCDALIFHQYQMQQLNLPNLRHEDILERLDPADLFTPDTLLWLWDTIASPVLATLGFVDTPSGTWPRVWWIPTGPLINFPIHAAGRYRSPSSESVLDRVVSSYSLSVKALYSSRKRTMDTIEGGEAAFVANRDIPGYAPLVFAPKELATLRPLCSSMGLHVIELRDGDDVVSALLRCKLFHFAGYFKEMENPLHSYLVLGGGFLTVTDLLKMDLRSSSPFLAYLSSCDTARTQNKVYADEGVHPTGAFRIAGFRHAIGTLGAK